jgi:hypothetical protein
MNSTNLMFDFDEWKTDWAFRDQSSQAKAKVVSQEGYR